MTAGAALAGILGAPVQIDEETTVGQVVGIVADRDTRRVLGLDVLSRTGGRVFLPWVGARVAGRVVHAHSHLVLINLGDLDGYLRRGAVVVDDASMLADWAVDGSGHVWGADTPALAAAR